MGHCGYTDQHHFQSGVMNPIMDDLSMMHGSALFVCLYAELHGNGIHGICVM